MRKTAYPVTPAIRHLRDEKIDYIPHLYAYEAHGGSDQAARALGLDPHQVIKTIVLQNEHKEGLIVLMHGDCDISTRQLARDLGCKHIEPATAAQLGKWTGYQPGGTSPFGCKTALPVYVERSIRALAQLYINGGKRGFLVAIAPDALDCLNARDVDVAITHSA